MTAWMRNPAAYGALIAACAGAAVLPMHRDGSPESRMPGNSRTSRMTRERL
jgi:hypothetical protein